MSAPRPSLATLMLILSLLSGASGTATAAGLPAGLPDPLVSADGTRVATAADWFARRRPELLAQFTHEMYGQSPGRPPGLTFEVMESDPGALGGRATRRQIRLWLTGATNGPGVDLLLYVPNAAKAPVPTILSINFWGNHAVHPDPAIRLASTWIESNKNPWADLSGVKDGRATEACRGVNAGQWPVEQILDRGYAFATFYRGDIHSDRPDGLTNGIHAAYPQLQGRGDNFGTIAAWAWGLSRAVDFLETDPSLDPRRVAAFGWSRLGKAALWAAANDTRIAAVLCNESGAGGAKLFRRAQGEDIVRLNRVFPHWYCGNFRKYDNQDATLPFDQHEVIALIAPRPVCVGSAIEDKWADPEGEFLALKGAEPVYRLLGADGVPSEAWPTVGMSAQGTLGYHVRPGGHDVTAEDWKQYLAFLDRNLTAARAEATSPGWRPLFDGKTLDGWVSRGGKAGYRVENGMIIGSSAPGTPNSFLCTTRDFTNFALHVEFKVDNTLNSGVQIRSHAFDMPTTIEWKGRTIKVPAGRVHGLQAEIDPSPRAWSAGLYEEGARGWLNDLTRNQPARRAFRTNDWNTYHIDCDGTSVRTWINGVPAASIEDDRVASGFIGLQVHGVGTNAAVREVRFRNLQIREK